MAFNKVILMGNLTADPEVRTTPSGQSVTSFSLAVNRTFRGSDGNRREETSFINCTAWGNTGETIAKYVGKGRQLLVSGRLQQRSWEDKETGKRRSAIDVIVEEFHKQMNAVDFPRALDAVWNIISRTNKYIDETAPWALETLFSFAM